MASCGKHHDGEEIKLFVDGKLSKKMKYDKGFSSNNEPLIIGWDKNRWLSHRHFKGSIDDIRIYNRALNKEEVLQLFNEVTFSPYQP